MYGHPLSRGRFQDACFEGLVARHGSISPAANQRLAHEVEVLEEHGLDSGLALAAEAVRQARDSGILVGPGHGTTAGSLACYALELTDIDPLANALFFERFFNPVVSDRARVNLVVQHGRVHEMADFIASRISVDVLRMVDSVGEFSSADGSRQWHVGSVELSVFGSKALSTIANTTALLDEDGTELDVREVSDNDGATFELLQRGDTEGVGGLEDDDMRRALREFRPESITDLAVVGALFHPGAYELLDSRGLGQAMRDAQLVTLQDVSAVTASFRPSAFDRLLDIIDERPRGSAPHYGDPRLNAVVAETAGVIVFQEQTIELAQECAGLSASAGDALRRAAGKHQRQALEGYREQWFAGAVERGIQAGTAEEVWGDVVRAGNWAFCRSHALACARTSYEAAYLKTHYRDEYGKAVGWA